MSFFQNLNKHEVPQPKSATAQRRWGEQRRQIIDSVRPLDVRDVSSDLMPREVLVFGTDDADDQIALSFVTRHGTINILLTAWMASKLGHDLHRMTR